MNALTATEVKILNNMSREHDLSVLLGDKLQQVVSSLPINGTPVNAVNAAMELAISGVSVHGEKVTINNPAVAGSDVYEFLADDAQTKSSPTNIAIDITAQTVKASGTLTVVTQPTAGDKMTIGTKVYTFVPVGTDTADGEVSIGTDLATAQAAIVAAINGTDEFNEAHPLVHAAAFDTNACIITALIGGTSGNSIATTETFTAVGNVFGDTTLKSGANCSAANTAAKLIAAITASDTQGVGATAGAGNAVELTADVAGAAGNAITLAETMANGAFTADATHLSGGVDGTVGSVGRPMIDATYVYYCVADNTIAGKNWRRVSLGSAY